MYKIIYWLLYSILLTIIIIYVIGYRGVAYDFFMSESEKNKFLIEYGIVIILSLLSLIILIFFKKK
jgi:hypothetical protein